MKKQLLLMMVTLLMAVGGVMAQAPNWLWAKSYNGTGGIFESSWGTEITTDKNGYVYVAGIFVSQTLTIGSTVLTNNSTIGSSFFYHDFYIAKLDQSGNVIWAKSYGGNKDDVILGLATDSSNNLIFTGSFSSPTLNMGSVTINNSGVSPIFSSYFLGKMDTNGNMIWLKTNSKGDATGYDLTIDKNNNTIIVGTFWDDTMKIDNVVLLNHENILPSQFPEVFIAKYSSTGNLMWAKSIGGDNDIYVKAVAVDGTNNVYVSGDFLSTTLYFGSDSINRVQSWGDNDYFIAKYDANGNKLWAKVQGSTNDDYAYNLAVDRSGDVIATGYAGDSMNIGSFVVTPWNFFLTKYSGSNGNVQWVKSYYCDNGIDNHISGVFIDSQSYIYMVGEFAMDSISFDNQVLHNANSFVQIPDDIFVTKHNSNGNAIWATSVGGDERDDTQDAYLDAAGSIYITGYFKSSSLSFGSHTLLNNHTDNVDVFVSKLAHVVGINEIPNNETITLYPNPTTGSITIKGITQPSVAVYNLMGQKVVAAQGSNEVSLAHLPAGMYMVQVFSKDGEMVKSEKVILNR